MQISKNKKGICKMMYTGDPQPTMVQLTIFKLYDDVQAFRIQ